jgi:hypothetical protein
VGVVVVTQIIRRCGAGSVTEIFELRRRECQISAFFFQL